MIHTLYEPVNFVVYSGSHLVKNRSGSNVKKESKLLLQFPENNTFMLLFHGLLVHCGAEALPSPDEENEYRKSVRLFSYVHNAKRRNARVRDEGERTHPQRSRGQIVTSLDVETKIVTEAKYLDVGELWNKKKKKVHETRRTEIIHIAGDMRKNGWAIYKGLSVDSCEGLKNDLEVVLSKDDKIKNIDSDLNSATRSHVRLDDVTDWNVPQNLLSFFDQIQIKLLQHVPSFKNAKLDSKQVLLNKGGIREQCPHSDHHP